MLVENIRFANDRFQAVLVDHRGHGDSGSNFSPPHNLDSCVEDVRRLIGQLKFDNLIIKDPSVVVGHSFGGKLALKWRDASESIRLTWTLDSAPAPINPAYFDSENKKESVVRLKKDLKTIGEFKTKADLVKKLQDHGFSAMVAQWMTTNVSTRADGSVGFVFDLNIVDPLFEDYCKQDLFPSLTANRPSSHVHFLRAGRNHHMWTDAVLSKFEHFVDKETVHLHTMPKAGHFLHAEDPEGVLEIMRPSFDQMTE